MNIRTKTDRYRGISAGFIFYFYYRTFAFTVFAACFVLLTYLCRRLIIFVYFIFYLPSGRSRLFF